LENFQHSPTWSIYPIINQYNKLNTRIIVTGDPKVRSRINPPCVMINTSHIISITNKNKIITFLRAILLHVSLLLRKKYLDSLFITSLADIYSFWLTWFFLFLREVVKFTIWPSSISHLPFSWTHMITNSLIYHLSLCVLESNFKGAYWWGKIYEI